MKGIFTLLASLFTVIAAAQPVIINSSDIPVPAGPFNNVEFSPVGPPAPPMGDNQTWDYSSYNGTVLIPNNITPETNVFFTAAGIDVQRPGFKDLNSSAGYETISKFDFNLNGVYESGISIPLQAYGLFDVTGNNQDSLIFPAQNYLLNDPSTLMQFPFTANSSWHSASRRSVDFDLTVAMFSLNHAPGQHVYTRYRNDSIVGWGKMRVYTTSGPSMWYDVLMDRFEEYAIDSFYLNGSPASQLLLDAFTVAQGQKTNAFYGYDFYRPGSFNFLVRVDFATDSTYSFVLGSYQNIDNILNTPETGSYSHSTLVFPNPVNTDEIFIRVIGGNFNFGDYIITDIGGRVVQEGNTVLKDEVIRINLDNHLQNGTYHVSIKDKSGKDIVLETISIQR